MSLGTETFVEDTHLHFPHVSGVKAWLMDDSMCTLKGKKSLEGITCKCSGQKHQSDFINV